MQPLDKTTFGSLYTAYNAACDKRMTSYLWLTAGLKWWTNNSRQFSTTRQFPA